MSVFAIGDTHLSFSSEKPMDIFGGWGDYVQRLEENWKRLVSDGDTVVIPGDISWALTVDEAEADFAFLNSLPGTKIIGKGNHDYWWSTKKKLEEFFDKNSFHTLKILRNNAFAVEGKAVCGTKGYCFEGPSADNEKIARRENERLRLSLLEAEKTGLEAVVFLHYPPITADSVCEATAQLLSDFGVKKCYYAHLHGNAVKSAFNGEYRGIDFRLISADALGFCPKFIY